MVCERPPRSLRSRLPLTRGRLALFSPSVRGRAAEGGRGALTHHLEFEVGNTPFSRGGTSSTESAEADAYLTVRPLVRASDRAHHHLESEFGDDLSRLVAHPS